MAPAFRFSTITEAQQYEELRRAYPKLYAAIDLAFPPLLPPRPELFMREPSLASLLAEATKRWPRLIAELVRRGGSPGASQTVPSNRLVGSASAPPLALTAPAAAPAPFLRSHDKFALRFRNKAYLIADPDDSTSWDFSKMPQVQWQLWLLGGEEGDEIHQGAPVALFNFTKSGKHEPGFFVPKDPSAQSTRPRWKPSLESGVDCFCWTVHHEPPYVQLALGNKAGEKALYYNSNLDELWIGPPTAYPKTATDPKDPNLITVRQPTPAERVAMMPCFGDFQPGERRYSGLRPETWAVECPAPTSGKDPYATIIRSPHLQDVTPTSAVVRWRIAIPEGKSIPAFKAKCAPVGVDLDGTGSSFEDAKGQILTKSDPPPKHCDEYSEYGGFPAYPLVRPSLEYRVRFENLSPGTLYHYRIDCGCWEPGVFVSGAAPVANPPMAHLANDVTFRTAPEKGSTNDAVTFVTMGDLGRGQRGEPSYMYDVYDLMHRVARDAGAHLWVILGDVDNVNQGDPDSMDPYLFSLFNAYHDRKWDDPPRTIPTTPYETEYTRIVAFRRSPYLGLLGGLPVYPVAGNHDVGACDSPGGNWSQCLKSFDLPPVSVGSLPLNGPEIGGHKGLMSADAENRSFLDVVIAMS